MGCLTFCVVLLLIAFVVIGVVDLFCFNWRLLVVWIDFVVYVVLCFVVLDERIVFGFGFIKLLMFGFELFRCVFDVLGCWFIV